MKRQQGLLRTALAVFVLCGLARTHAQELTSQRDFWKLPIVDLNAQPIPLDEPDTKAIAVVLISPDCPIANSFQPELRRIDEVFRDQGVKLILVHATPGIDVTVARKHVREFQIVSPVAIDPDLVVAAALKADVVPSAFVFDSRSKSLVYHGRIDNTFETLGKKRVYATTHELRTALSAVLTGENPPVAFAEPIGCRINFSASTPAK